MAASDLFAIQENENGLAGVERYEIRIAKSGREPVSLASEHVSDHAAVRKAIALTSDQDAVEVWRNDVCVYAREITDHHLKPVRLSL